MWQLADPCDLTVVYKSRLFGKDCSKGERATLKDRADKTCHSTSDKYYIRIV